MLLRSFWDTITHLAARAGTCASIVPGPLTHLQLCSLCRTPWGLSVLYPGDRQNPLPLSGPLENHSRL